MDANEYIKKKFRVKGNNTLPFKGWNDSTRKDLHDLFRELNFKIGAEIGVYRGYNAKAMLKRIPGLKLICVDPWGPFTRHTAEQMEAQFQRCKQRLRRWDVEYIRKESVEAAKQVKDKSLDFVYIDGMHDFDNVMMDQIMWVPKVRIGGIVSGHDYHHNHHVGVIRAVDAYTYAHNVTEWYITGGQQLVDRHPSFFWVKQ
jgi:predicted O-methyltransferase YrrM